MSNRQLTQEHLDLKTVRAIKEIFASKDHWMRGRTAATYGGQRVGCNSPAAYKFCFMGALARVTGKQAMSGIIDPDARRIFGHSASNLVSINDGRGYDAVMATLDDAEVRLNSLVASLK